MMVGNVYAVIRRLFNGVRVLGSTICEYIIYLVVAIKITEAVESVRDVFGRLD